MKPGLPGCLMIKKEDFFFFRFSDFHSTHGVLVDFSKIMKDGRTDGFGSFTVSKGVTF
jgi:hypothetical protein